ncbi:peroxiredoxin family protein [Paenibacillus tyrfis]|uniref:peroxiredoxin family protein n=1 Tax=Paenibacillus tyrfis TaxID=1501230 RepID=UPI000B59736D|nr:hypothetical protein [Paenibacillus tyrfis]
MHYNLNEFRSNQPYPLNLLGLPTEAQQYRIVCAVSLNCGHCLQLLPQFKPLGSNFNFEFVLVTDGTEEENKSIKEQLGFSFHMISFAHQNFSDIGISFTPQAYLIDLQGNVVQNKEIRQVDDLKNFWLKGSEMIDDAGSIS